MTRAMLIRALGRSLVVPVTFDVCASMIEGEPGFYAPFLYPLSAVVELGRVMWKERRNASGSPRT